MAGFMAFGNLSFNTAPAGQFSGAGVVKGPVADCGTGDGPCPPASGGICLLQAKARAAKVGNTTFMQLPTTCDMVQYCFLNGAKAAVLVPPAEVPYFGPFPPDVSPAGRAGRGGAGRAGRALAGRPSQGAPRRARGAAPWRPGARNRRPRAGRGSRRAGGRERAAPP
jgi:hypothetical protein